MGCSLSCPCKPPPMGFRLSARGRAAAKRSRMIERRLLQPEDVESKAEQVKLLLVGLPESGKSTILKQMKIIHSSGYSEEACKQHKPLVYRSAILSIAATVQAMARLGAEFSEQARAEDAQLVIREATGRAGDSAMMTPQVSKAIERLWADGGVQECLSRSRENHLSDSATYYLNNWERIGEAAYVPTQQDLLMSSGKTTGVAETRFAFRRCNYTVYDVGGQRPSSHRWLECFRGVTALVFCVALSDYDLAPTDGEECNAMHRSLKLLEDIRKKRWLEGTPAILLLNKKDLFEKKIKVNPLSKCFPDYTGPNTYEEASAYIQGVFESCWNQDGHAPDLITHFTCATNTREMQLVFDAIADYIMTATGRYHYVIPHPGYCVFLY